jgi:hypothetical protein
MSSIEQMKFKNSTLLIIIIFFSSGLLGQHELGTYMYPEFDYNYNLVVNKDSSDHKLTVSSSYYANFSSNSIKLDDISDKAGNVRTIDFDKGVDLLADINSSEFYQSYNFLHLNYNLSAVQIKFGYNWRSSFEINYPRALFELLANGNNQFVGQTVDIAPSLNIRSYHDIYAGFSGEFGNLQVGANVHFLSGTENFILENASIELSISDEIFQFELENNIDAYTTRILSYQSISDASFSFRGLDFRNAFIGNYGVAIDLMLRYDLGAKTSIFASVYDLGSIQWNNSNSQKLSSTGTENYTGIDIVTYLDIDDNLALRDSIESLLSIQEDTLAYTTALRPVIAAGVQHKINDKLDLSLIIQSQRIAGRRYNNFAVGLRHKISKQLKVGIQYSVKTNTYNNIGLNGSLEIAGFQLFAMADNILSAFNPTGSQQINGRIGLNYRI